MRSSYYILFIFSTLTLFFGCSPTKYLQEDQYLLHKQTIKGNKNIPLEDLTPLFKQTPNRRFLGQRPYVTIYNIGRSRFDTSEIQKDLTKTKNNLDTLIEKSRVLRRNNRLKRNKLDSIIQVQSEKTPLNLEEKKGLDNLIKEKKELAKDYTKDSSNIEKKKGKIEKELNKLEKKLNDGNWIMRAPGETPVAFDSTKMAITIANMSQYLVSKGFFRSSVTSQIDTIKRNVKVTYFINEGISYNIKNIRYAIEDKAIDSLVKANTNESFIKEGERYNENALVNERDRITKLLKNNGYYDFNRQYLFIEVDTTVQSEAELTLKIINPVKGLHEVYSIEKIIFNTDVTPRPDEKRDTVQYNGIDYVFYKNNFSKKILGNKIKFRPGDIYSQKQMQESQIQLASMDIFKFVNFSFEKNIDTSKKTLTTQIRTSPFNKYQISDEWGVNVGQGFIPGPYASLTFKNRNVFKGFEIFEISLKYSLEGAYSQQQDQSGNKAIIMTEYGGTMSLSFPQIFFPKFGKLAHLYSPRTKISAGYNFVNRPEYIRSNLRTALNYSWQRNINKSYNVNIIDINIVRTPFIDKGFESFINSFPALSISFRQSIVTSFNASYTYNNYMFGVIKKSKYFRPSFEIGGIVVNALSRYVSKEPGNKFLGLQYFEFIKTSVDFRHYYPSGKRNTFAMRHFAGIAMPYGSSAKENVNAIPYEKYFFIGGGNSIRAWRPRRLGPGSYKDPVNGYRYEQPGEIILETSYEYRKHIIKFFEMGFFVDAGNIWTFKNEPNRPGSQFKFDKFFTQIAVGTGIGFRFNFTFLILRFDLGTKVWDPGSQGADRLAIKDIFRTSPLLNIGIGYPF